MHTGTKIKELRKARNMTQEELGELLGVKKAAIQKYEKGDIINLKLATIKKLCDIFQIEPGKLIFPEAEEIDQRYDVKRLSLEVKVMQDLETLYGIDAIKVIRCFTELNETGKSHALQMLEVFASLPKYTSGSR